MLDPLVQLFSHLDDNIKMLGIKSIDSNSHLQEITYNLLYWPRYQSLFQPKHGASIRNYKLTSFRLLLSTGFEAGILMLSLSRYETSLTCFNTFKRVRAMSWCLFPQWISYQNEILTLQDFWVCVSTAALHAAYVTLSIAIQWYCMIISQLRNTSSLSLH
jgi:hypothetical protein